ncbi:MAG: FeoB-associated Cys-rich membrane protein [Flavobacteriaceae bacterium]
MTVTSENTIILLLLVAAVFFLFRKKILKQSKGKNCGGNNCDC